MLQHIWLSSQPFVFLTHTRTHMRVLLYRLVDALRCRQPAVI